MRWFVVGLLGIAPVGAEARPSAEPLELVQASPLHGIVQLSLGAQHSCGRRKDGAVICWGDNEQGQRGDQRRDTRLPDREAGPTPSIVRTFGDLLAVAAGSLHTCALTTAGVTCWGHNSTYQLGTGDATNPTSSVSGGDRSTPEASRRFGKPTAIALGDVSYAIDAAGAVTCIGHSNFCGWETATSPVPNLPPIASIAVGDGHACAVSRSGEVHCWGRTDWGQGGSGLDHTDQAPTKISGLANIVEIAAGGAHSCARTRDGDVYCWGLNDQGQLGDGTTTQRNRPVKVGIAHVEQLAIGGFGSCARVAGGTVSCWGHQMLAPKKQAGLANVVEVAAGGAHACARLADDTVRCWGDNDDGQLGDGSTTSSTAPVTVVAIRAK